MHIQGLHHVTAIASDPQHNLDFYAGVLGLRLVKRTINFDDPGRYHFYFGDETGSPGTILTFFPWPNARRGRRGSGETESTALAIRPESPGYWTERLKSNGISVERLDNRFDKTVLRFADPDGTFIELIASDVADSKSVTPWIDGPIPLEHAIRGFHSVSLAVDLPDRTSTLLTGLFGYHLECESGNRTRFVSTDPNASGPFIDLVASSKLPPGRMGAGSVHHVAFRVPDDERQIALREQLATMRFDVSPVMERTYFRSIYFREPNGVLFEIATDGPGMMIDENKDELGMHLRLPSWLESSRPRIRSLLPKIHLPTGIAA